MRPGLPDQSTAATWVAVALLIAALCNGANVYLKRTGFIEGDAYRAYWSAHCEHIGPGSAHAAAEPRCCSRLTHEEIALHRNSAIADLEDERTRYLFVVSASERALKLLKDLLGLALIAVSVLLIAKREVPVPALRENWPVCLLLGYVAMEFLVSLFFNGTLVAAAGARAFMFAVIALLAQWVAPHIGVVARYLGVLLVVQALLLPLELFRGIHSYGEWSPLHLAERASGTLVHPNTLGIFAITALAFCYAFMPARAWLAALAIAALAVVLCSGSGTGIVCAVLLFFVVLNDRIGEGRRAVVAISAVLVCAVVVLALPVLTGREWILDSLLAERGRLRALFTLFAERGLLETLFGSGLGTGGVLALQLQDQANLERLDAARLVASKFTDSTLTGLIVEIGVLGAAMFYGALAWAGLRDRAARPFYWIVALSSLTVNVTVLFPLNFLIGLAWAHSAWGGRRA
jgi:hypothetical protein